MPLGARNVVLIGFMGTGKSSVGKVLARKLGRVLIDTDAVVEERAGRKIRDIFEKEGESRFRVLEKEAVYFAATHTKAVITTGGGVVLNPENLAALRENGVIVALSASVEPIARRDLSHTVESLRLSACQPPKESVKILISDALHERVPT